MERRGSGPRRPEDAERPRARGCEAFALRGSDVEDAGRRGARLLGVVGRPEVDDDDPAHGLLLARRRPARRGGKRCLELRPPGFLDGPALPLQLFDHPRWRNASHGRLRVRCLHPLGKRRSAELTPNPSPPPTPELRPRRDVPFPSGSGGGGPSRMAATDPGPEKSGPRDPPYQTKRRYIGRPGARRLAGRLLGAGSRASGKERGRARRRPPPLGTATSPPRRPRRSPP